METELFFVLIHKFEQGHFINNNDLAQEKTHKKTCVTSKDSDQPAGIHLVDKGFVLV